MAPPLLFIPQDNPPIPLTPAIQRTHTRLRRKGILSQLKPQEKRNFITVISTQTVIIKTPTESKTTTTTVTTVVPQLFFPDISLPAPVRNTAISVKDTRRFPKSIFSPVRDRISNNHPWVRRILQAQEARPHTITAPRDPLGQVLFPEPP
jgi:hypothetical protein